TTCAKLPVNTGSRLRQLRQRRPGRGSVLSRLSRASRPRAGVPRGIPGRRRETSSRRYLPARSCRPFSRYRSRPAARDRRRRGARKLIPQRSRRTRRARCRASKCITSIGRPLGATGGGTLLFTSDPVDAGQAFDHLGVHWVAALGSEDTFYVEVRTSRDGASWSEWAVFTADEDMADHDRNEWFAGPYAVPAARFAQYRVWLTGGDAGALEQVALSFMDVSDLNAGPIARLASDLHGALSDFGRSYAEAAPAGASAIRSRQDWAADENLMLWAP